MREKTILVTGHKNPDTDSFCSAISYAYFKTQKGEPAKPICAGTPNKETAFALDYFGVEVPPVVHDFYVKIGDLYKEIPGVPKDATLAEIGAWREQYQSNRIPVVDGDTLLGIIFPPDLITAALDTIRDKESTIRAKDICKDDPSYVKTLSQPMKDLKGIHCGHLPVVDEEGRYKGLIYSHEPYPKERQEVILVDHNEKVQIIDGIEEATIKENIDHHRINLTTDKPIFIHYEPVGCTCTIIASFYRAQNIEIPKHIAGLLLSAIISDTVLFRSPTCTQKDIDMAHYLAPIAGVDLEEYGMAMLKAGADVSDLTYDEIVRTDMKEFTGGDKVISIAQISLMDTEDILTHQADLVAALEGLRKEKSYHASFLMVTNILKESTDLVYSGPVDAMVETAFQQKPGNNAVFLTKTMSRKKQIVPPILEAMK